MLRVAFYGNILRVAKGINYWFIFLMDIHSDNIIAVPSNFKTTMLSIVSRLTHQQKTEKETNQNYDIVLSRLHLSYLNCLYFLFCFYFVLIVSCSESGI